MFADPPEESEEGEEEELKKANFVHLDGFAELNAYLFQHQAVIVLPLLLAIHRRLDMKGATRTKIALSASVWKDAGLPPAAKRTRETVLAHLRRMPELVTLQRSQSLVFRYYVEKGPAWRKMEEAGRGTPVRKGKKG
jgi:hypothetical protein